MSIVLPFIKRLIFAGLVAHSIWTPVPARPCDDSGDDTLVGELSGRVFDAQNRQPLADVNVVIPGSNFGAATAADGTYLIRNLPPGVYVLHVTRIGYEKVTTREVHIKPGRLTVKNVELRPTAIELDEVVMTASRKEQTAYSAPASVAVVTNKEISQRNAATFDQALETVPGISLQRSIGVSVQSLSLRGSSDVAGGGVGNRVLLAIDSRPALSSDSGGALWSLVPTNFIDRIEVVKGAFSSLYGSTAMGGVINVITQKPQNEMYLSVNASGGFHELPPKPIRYRDTPALFNTLEINHSNRTGKLGYLISLSRKESDGHTQRGAYKFYNLYGKLFLDFANNRNLEITVGGDFGRNDYPHTWFSNLQPLEVAPAYADDVQHKKNFSSDIYYYAVPNPQIKYSTRFYFYRQYFRTEFNPDDRNNQIPNNEPFGLFIRSDSRKFGNITQLDYYLSDRNYLIAGLDIQRDLVDSVPDSILYGKRQVNNLAVYLQDDHQLSRRIALNFGLRYDYNRLEGGRTLTQLSPKAAIMFNIFESWSLRFLVGRAFRAPSIAERFFQEEIAGRTKFRPNPDLDAEKVTSLEFGSRFRIGSVLNLDFALFHNTYRDMIYWINLTTENGENAPDGGFLFQVQNLNKALMQGIEISIDLHPNRYWNTQLSYTYLDAEDKSDVKRFGSLAYKVRHTFTFVSSVKTGPWILNLDGRYNSKVEEVFLYPNDKPDAFFVINGKMIRQLGKNVSLSVGVKNIFDIQYEELARYRMPGRTWIFSTSYEF